MSDLLAKDIPTVYPTKEEWNKKYGGNQSIPQYQPNKEIINDDYDKSLAVKCFNGTFVGKIEDDVATWKGIPFAKQPIGNLRWKRAQAPQASDKIFEAYYFGSTCLEMIDDTERASQYHQGEDNLNLNIWSSNCLNWLIISSLLIDMSFPFKIKEQNKVVNAMANYGGTT